MVTHGELAVQYIRSLVAGQGRPMAASAFAAGKGPAWDGVAKLHKAAVTASGQDDIVGLNRPIGADIRQMLRPLTIRGRMLGARRVDFFTRMLHVDSGSSAAFVGAGKPIPASLLNLNDAGVMGRLKVAAIIPISEEVAKSASPTATAQISRDVSAALAYAEDVQFANWLSAGVADVSPASIAYGATSHVIGGTTFASWDTALSSCVDTLIDGGSTLEYAVWIMSGKTARVLSSLRDNGSLAYPGMRVRGNAELMGLPVIQSGAINAVGSPLENFLILADASQIWLSDSDDIEIELSRHASLQLTDAPTNDASTATAAQMISAWQTSTVAIRAVRYVNWHPMATTSTVVLRGFSH